MQKPILEPAEEGVSMSIQYRVTEEGGGVVSTFTIHVESWSADGYKEMADGTIEMRDDPKQLPNAAARLLLALEMNANRVGDLRVHIHGPEEATT